jgi:peroxiredoxin
VKKLLCCLLLLVAPAPSPALERMGAGMEPPPFTLSTTTGAAVSIDYFQGGPGVIIFWSTWSPRSAEVLGDFRDLQARGGGTGLKVVAVNADREQFSAADRETVAREAVRMQLPFPVVLDEGLRTYAAYGVMALPSTVVLGADGRIAYSLAGYPLSYRDELQDKALLALGDASSASSRVATATSAGDSGPAAAAARAASTDCVLPRARFCRFDAERARSTDDPGITSMRLAICRGDAEGAERLMPALGMGRFDRPEVRFALAELMLLKGGAVEAKMAFDSLRQRHPGEAWGEWGLGLLALADGREHDALAHMRVAAARGGACVEAETAVLQYLQGFWLEERQAPTEAGFLAIFAGLAPIRDCFAQRRPG